MANKEIKIRAVLDSQGFDNEVNKLQQKLKQMQQQSEGLGKAQNQHGGAGGDKLMGRLTQQALGGFNKDSKKELEALFQSQKRQAIQQNISIKGHEAALKGLAAVQGDLTRQQQQETKELEKQLGLLREKHNMTLQDAASTKKVLGQVSDGAEQAGGGNMPPNSGGAGGGFKSGMMSMLKGIGIAGIVKGALNAVVTGAQHVVTRDRKMLTDSGQSANIVSREMREDFAGKGSKGIFFAQERRDAMVMAAQEKKSQGAVDYLKTGAMAAGGAALAVGGAAAIATGVGAPLGVGMLAGAGAVGAAAGFGGAMSNDRLRSRVFDQEQYEKMTTKEGLQNYEANLAAKKALDPRKTMAQEQFQTNAGRYQKMQRSMGFTNDDQLFGRSDANLSGDGQASPYPQPNSFGDAMDAISNVPQMNTAWGRSGRGQAEFNTGMQGLATPFTEGQSGVLARGMGSDDVMSGLLGIKPSAERQSEGYLIDQKKSGVGGQRFDKEKYSDENILRQRGDILAGGGATSGQNLAGSAATFERNLNMDNAGSIFGKIQGAGMGQGETQKQTEDATKRLLAEGVKLGVDTSKMPAEMMRFTTAAAQVLTQGGGLSDTAVSRFAGGLTGTTQKEIDSGMSAYEEGKSKSKQAGDIEGQIGLGQLMGKETNDILGKGKDGKQKKLGARHLHQLNAMSLEDLESDPKLLKGLAGELGISEAKVKEIVGKKDAKKQTKMSGLEKLVDEYGAMSEKEQNSKAGSMMYSKIQGLKGQEDGSFNQKDSSRRAAGVNSMVAFQKGAPNKLDAELQKVKDDLATEPDTAGNAEEGSKGTGQSTAMKALRENLDGLKKAAKAHTESAEMYNKTFALFIKAAGEGGKSLGTLKGQLDQVIDMLVDHDIHPKAQPNDG